MSSLGNGEANHGRGQSLVLVARFLVAGFALAVVVAALAIGAWYLESTKLISGDDLSQTDKQRLFDEMQEAVPGIYEMAWFQPEIGYTLRPNSEISAWNDTFVSNELGYRTGKVRKRRGTFRILFVGDSWAYGMGVKRQESYPELVADLANTHADLSAEVEAWTLALPGYNTVNQTAAFDFWFGDLRPNLVIFAPSANDNHSNSPLLPSGQLAVGTSPTKDSFGTYPVRYLIPVPINSFQYMDRWRQVYERYQKAERKLEYYKIPSIFFYVARWDPSFVHKLNSEASLKSSYAVVPKALTVGQWENPPPALHGTPEAQRRYAQLLYRLISEELGWSPLPTDVLLPEIASEPLFLGPPQEDSWRPTLEAILESNDAQWVQAKYQAGSGTREQWAGAGDFENGLLGKATTILIRPPAGTESLRVELQRLDSLRAFYPIEVRLEIVARNNPTSTVIAIPETGEVSAVGLLAVPSSLQDGSVLEVRLEASSVAALSGSRVAASARVVSIEPAR